MNQLCATLVLVVLLAGCAQRPDGSKSSGAEDALATLVVDLHKNVLDITMPAGQPTAVVVLNVTEDMWMRPVVDVVPPNPLPVEDSRWWVICPWVKATGMSEGSSLRAFTYWVEKDRLILTGNPGAERAEGQGGCTGGTWNDVETYSVTSEQPRLGTLALVLSAVPIEMSFAAPPSPSPELHALVGVGQRCADGTSICVPDASVPAEPALRGGLPIHAYRKVDAPCEDCGFQVDDQRAFTNGDLGPGRVVMTRGATPGPGLAYVYTGNVGPTTLRAELKVDGEVVSASCVGATHNNWVVLVAAYDQAATATIDVVTELNFPAHVIELPIDLASLGYTVEPYAEAFSGSQSPDGATTTRLCT